MEVKIMKEIDHENLNPFIGICPEPQNCCLLMKYAPRGSVQDILQNDDAFLPLDFKVSLATDIGRGMAYIHGSLLGEKADLLHLLFKLTLNLSISTTEHNSKCTDKFL